MACGQKVRIGLVALALVAAGACGDDGGDDEAGGNAGGSSTDDGGGDRYAGELEDGSTLSVRLDVAADDPAVAPYESFRALTGAAEPTWIVAEISVPEGTDGTGRFLTFIEEGIDPLDDDPLDQTDGVVSSGFACSELDDWYQAADPDESLDAAYQELYEGPCGGQTLQVIAPAGETTTYVLVLDGPIPPFESIRAGLLTELEPT